MGVDIGEFAVFAAGPEGEAQFDREGLVLDRLHPQPGQGRSPCRRRAVVSSAARSDALVSAGRYCQKIEWKTTVATPWRGAAFANVHAAASAGSTRVPAPSAMSIAASKRRM